MSRINTLLILLAILLLALIIGVVGLMAGALHLLPPGPELKTLVVVSLLGLLTMLIREILKTLREVASTTESNAPQQDGRGTPDP